jgi:hypothetical protein
MRKQENQKHVFASNRKTFRFVSTCFASNECTQNEYDWKLELRFTFGLLLYAVSSLKYVAHSIDQISRSHSLAIIWDTA